MLPPAVTARRIASGAAGWEAPAAVVTSLAGGAAAPARIEKLNQGPERVIPLWETERQAIETAIEHFEGNILRAAAALEISPSTIYRKRQAWEERTGGTKVV